uniref:Uncharacterized protein n=1 Tax=Arundo donax TaxID=35708 RepID=A0A0A8XVC7_ARUDO
MQFRCKFTTKLVSAFSNMIRMLKQGFKFRIFFIHQ